jgi:hypothetical protein
MGLTYGEWAITRHAGPVQIAGAYSVSGERSSMAPRSVHFGVQSWEIRNVGQSLVGGPKIHYLELLRASEGTLSRWSRLHLQSLAPTNPH